MAKAISARQFGDEYQQLVFWKYALNLLSGNYEIDKIKYEDEAVKSYDLDTSFINATKYSLLDNVVLAFRSLGDEFKNCKFVIYSMWDIA